MFGMRKLQGGGGRLVASLVLASFGLAIEARGQAQTVLYYVDADTGDDLNNDGSLRLPFKTVNKSLFEAWRDLHPIPNDDVTEADVDVVIKIKKTTTPIAPAGFGGVERQHGGWQTYAEFNAGTQHDPFPIRMIKRVSLEGVISGGQRPRITINENIGGPYTAWDGFGVSRRAFVHGAEASSLSNLFLDGTVFQKKKTNGLQGVLAENLPCFVLNNIRIEDTYDGVYFLATPQPPGFLGGSSGSIIDCEIIGQGMINFANPAADNQGHAGLWMIGPGSFNVAVSGTRFEGCHDAVEYAGDPNSSARLSMDNCVFQGNENGIEAVGEGLLTCDLVECQFIGNYNQQNGMPMFLEPSQGNAPNSPGAIVARGAVAYQMTVRSCTFLNCSFGGIFKPGLPSTFDLGVTGSYLPGLNTFNYNFSEFQIPGTDPFRVAIYVEATASPVTVLAGGNTWFHVNLNQYTDANGCLTNQLVGQLGASENLVPSPHNETILAPPGPTVGLCCDPASGLDWKRNFSLGPGATIDFGSDCLPQP